MSEIIFRETQKFKQIWVILILIIILGIWIWGIIQQIILGTPFGNRPVSDTGLILIGLIALFPIVLIIMFKMITEIRKDGIYYRLFPVMKFKKIKPEEIESWQVTQYNPIKEFGGWGYRFSIRRKGGKAINVNGKMGLRLILKSGKKILLGTQKHEEIEKAMQKITAT